MRSTSKISTLNKKKPKKRKNVSDVSLKKSLSNRNPLKGVAILKDVMDIPISEEEHSSEEELFEIPSILKKPKLFASQCEISSFDHYFIDNETNDSTIDTIKNKEIVTRKKDKRKKISSESLLEKSNNSNIVHNFSEEEITEKNDRNKFVDSNIGFKDSVQCYELNDGCIFVLKHPIKLFFYGKLKLSVLSGIIKVFGYNLSQSDKNNIELYSLQGSNFLYFETIDTAPNPSLKSLLKKYSLSDEVSQNIVTSENICVILLKEIKNQFTVFIDKLPYLTFLPKMPRFLNDDNRLFPIVEMKFRCLFEVNPFSNLASYISEDWTDVVDLIKKLSVTRNITMVCGGKNVGKSTCLKYIVNELLNDYEKVVFIDLDPGQSEFTICGCVSATIVDAPVFGPNYAHLKRPERCHFLGEINVNHCVERYLQAIQQIMRYCATNIKDQIPWVVNYMGFTKSFGTDLIASVIKYINPTTLVQIQSSNEKNNFPSVLTAGFIKRHLKHRLFKPSKECNDFNTEEINYTTKVIRSVNNKYEENCKIEPKILRDTCIVSYFNDVFNSEKSETCYSVNLSSIKCSHINTINSSDKTQNEMGVINGNLVALCVDGAENCIGFGIVRGFDVANDKLYLITPEPLSVLTKVNSLIMGQIMLPMLFYVNKEFKGPIPYLCHSIKQNTTNVPKRCYKACKFLIRKNNS